MNSYTLRIIDANFNRIEEGLRFLEEVARLALNDVVLSKQLKEIRHSFADTMYQLGIELISGRNSVSDVGAMSVISSRTKNLASLVVANAKRVEQGLRVMEEMAKLAEVSHFLRSEYYQQARFNVYELERNLISRILRHQKLSLLSGLYVIIDSQILGNKDIIDAANCIIEGGASVIQLRDKKNEKGLILKTARQIKKICKDSNVLFVINDHLDVVLAADADGLHIGQDDLPLPIVRKILGIDKIVGLSTHTIRQAKKAVIDGADYIAVGSIFPTTTKSDTKVVGLTYLKNITEQIAVPVVAIGGINRDNISSVFSAGASSAAVISAVLTHDNIEEATKSLVKTIVRKKKTDKKFGKNS